MEHVWGKTSRARGSQALPRRLPLRVAERVDVGIYVKCTNKRELVISVFAYSTLHAADAPHMSVEITMVPSSARPLITIGTNPRCMHLRLHAHATQGSKWQCWLIARRLGGFELQTSWYMHFVVLEEQCSSFLHFQVGANRIRSPLLHDDA
jgi:hypothetical protein